MIDPNEIVAARRALGRQLARYRRAAGLNQLQLAPHTHYARSTIANVEVGRQNVPRGFWERADEALNAGGRLVAQHDELVVLIQRQRRETAEAEATRRAHVDKIEAAVAPGLATEYPVGLADQEVSTVPTRREVFGYVGVGLTALGYEQVTTRLPRVVQAFETTHENAAGAVTLENIVAVVEHYKRAVRSAAPADLYDEILGVRVHTGRLLKDGGLAEKYRRDMLVMIGWLSNLLALVTHDLSDRAASLVWCSDAERQSRAANYPELAGWAAQTRVLMSFYEGQAQAAVAYAQRGQRFAPIGSVVRAKLLAHEMRAWALLGNAQQVTSTRRRAEEAAARLSADTPRHGAFSISLADDPPYTATSLLLLGRYREAADATRRVLATFYSTRPDEERNANPSAYARTYLILALALAGLGQLEEACAAGSKALESPRLVCPTAVLAGRLDQVLRRNFSGAAEALDYHDRYAAAVRDPLQPTVTDASS